MNIFKKIQEVLFQKRKIPESINNESQVKYGVSIGPVEGLTWINTRHIPFVGVSSDGKEMTHQECVDFMGKQK